VPESKLSYHPGAEDDYVEPFAWYFDRSSAIIEDFEREVDRGLRLILQSSLSWPKFDDQRRKMILRKFPYSIIYEIIDQEIVVLAVAHGRRRLHYWRERTKTS
jgi:plasmid stabilization system protein ParE